MSNKQRRAEKKRKKLKKKQKREKRINDDFVTLIKNTKAKLGVDPDVEEEVLSLPIAFDCRCNTEVKLEELQAATLFMWDNYKVRSRNKDDLERNSIEKFAAPMKDHESLEVDNSYYEISNILLSLFERECYNEEYLEILRETANRTLEVAIVAGYVVDVKYGYDDPFTGEFYKNVVSAICISTVDALNKNREFEHVSDHMWLYMNRLHKHSRMIVTLQQEDIDVRIGDRITILGTVKQYSYGKDNTKFGIDWWFPIDSYFHYYRPKNGKIIHDAADSNLKGKAHVFCMKEDSFIFDGVTKTGIKSKLEEDLEYLRKLAKVVYGGQLKRLTSIKSDNKTS